MTEPYIVWMWQHYSLSAFPCETLERAVRLAEGIEDMGDGSTDCIEGPEGVVSADAIEPIVRRIREEERAQMAARPESTYGIKVTSPNGKDSAWWGSYTSREEAEAALAPLRERFGDRAKIHEYGRP
jgi:hypothetical protein